MNREIDLYIKDILDNMDNAEKFIANMTFEAFSADIKTAYAVSRCIEIIGEASKNVPAVVRKQYPDIPAGMRDKVIHFYFGVNYKRVWLVVKNDIPKIRPFIANVFKELHKKDNKN
ncbi:MAG: DUF86 domain-containing protein [Proteobacteria bacterium]|nr:DUF86 domain-containing protein [Pseudomonadota bacterium]